VAADPGLGSARG